MESKNLKMRQLIFEFPFKLDISSKIFMYQNNFSAYKLIENWPNWSGKWLNILDLLVRKDALIKNS